MQEKVLFDTDIGSDVDDALALAYLLCEPGCNLLGVTTVSGEPEKRAGMVSSICRNLGRDDVEIHVGCERPLLLETNRQPEAQQAAALKDWPHRTFERDNTAIEFMRRTIRANPGEVTLLAVGPLTNVAVLFATDPAIPSLLKRLVLMCGFFFDSMGGEWNAICDPHATAITYGCGPQDKPAEHVSFGLDVTCKVILEADDARQRFSGKKVLEPVRDFAEIWFSSRPRVTFHDPLAAVSLFHPEICTYQDRNITVPVDGVTAGWTVPHYAPEGAAGKHRIAARVDSARFFDLYFNTLK